MKLLLLIVFISNIRMEVFDGYTLFTPYSATTDQQITRLIDNDYNIINTWLHQRIPASMPYLLPDSSILYPYMVDFPTMIAGGVGGGIQKISWDGTIVWDYIFSDSLYQHHHDIEPMPNGNILIIAWEKKTIMEAYSMGRSDIESWVVPEMWSTAIFELNPESGLIEWEWHLWDHLIQDTDSSFGAFFGSISDHPELFDINCGAVGLNEGGPQAPNGDWMHINSVHYNPNLDQIILSSRAQNEFYIIDHSTTTEEAASNSGGNSGKGGNILYRWGNPQNYGRGTHLDKILGSQHSVNWIPEGYPGEGNIILFNNFHEDSHWDTHSAVIELVPPMIDDNYIISDNNPFGPNDLHWEFISNLLIPMQGGAFRLPNGNTIITFTTEAKIIEVDNDHNIIWEYIYDGDNSEWIARSNKYNLDYLNDILLGDINSDGILNILDIVLMVNMVLNNEFNLVSDVNEDGLLDILDIVLMVNILVGGLL